MMYPVNVKKMLRARYMIVSEQIPVICVSRAPMK